MDQMKWRIPEGMQDTLPGECRRKRAVEAQLRKLFALNGYQEVETPLMEYYAVLEDETYGYAQQHVWKTFDRHGMVLALRPDSTIPAVRMAASKLGGQPLPLRLCYMQDAVSFQQQTAWDLSESAQAGIELMGAGSPYADGEVIALAIQALEEAGLTDFQIELGQVAFFKGLMAEAGLSQGQGESLRGYVEEKNMLAIQLFLQKCEVSQAVAARLMALPQLYGGAGVLDKASSITQNQMCLEAISNLRQVMAVLTSYGYEKYITVDLGMVHGVNYYSGVIFRGITGCLGQPLLSGGRYDGLPLKFGRDMPATGFALSLKLLMMALERQGETFTAPVADVMVGFDREAFCHAVAYTRAKRAQGFSACMAYDADETALRKLVKEGRARAGIYIQKDNILQCGEGCI